MQLGSAGGVLVISASWYKGGVFCETAAGSVSYGLRADGSHGPLSTDETAEQANRMERLAADASAGKLPEISLDEFQQHVTESSLWVAYGGIVYDVTSFAAEHPGGADALYGAGGQDLEIMWKHYPVHYNKPEVMDALAPYAIGILSEKSMEALRDPRRARKHLAVTLPLNGSGSCNDAMQRSRQRMFSRLCGLWVVTLTSSFWWWTRGFLRVLSRVPLIGRPLAESCSSLLPCSVPGLGGAAPLPTVDAGGKPTKVAVVGGGIAGCSCAFSLAESGYDVTIYESRKVLGGNAQLATFPVGKEGEEKMVSQDLSVLYWAPEFYRNYSALLQHLGVKAATVELPYVIHNNAHGVSEFYTQPGSASGLDRQLRPSLEERYIDDFRRYDRMISCIGKINSFFRWGSSRTSFYETNQVTLLPFFCPLNYVGLRTASRLFGCSDEFWNNVIKPFHGLNLSTVHIDNVPGTAFEILDAISPLHRSRTSMTWDLGNSQEVFQRATAKCSIKLDTRVRQVQFSKESGLWKQQVVDDHGEVETFDRVVLACPASAAANIIRPMNWMEQNLIRAVEYHDEVHHSDWKDWLDVPVHQDTSCLPAQHHSSLLEHAAFLIDVDARGREGGGVNVEYTHNLGAFSPSARSLGVAPADCPMFMTQCQHKTRTINPSSVIQSFSAPRGHPCLSTHNMIITQMLHLVQGRRGIYYCSNWTSPGNGHDLACTSGLAVASAIGAEYPLKDEEARRDHRDCRRFMWI